MPAPKFTRRLFWTVEFLLLAGTVGCAVWVSHSAEWEPAALVALLLALALLGERFSVETSSGILSASFVALVLAMGLLGPVPAALGGAAAAALHSAVERHPPARWLNNLTTWTLAPFAGGLMVGALAGDVHQHQSYGTTEGFVFGLIVLGASVVFLTVNFILYALDVRVEEGRPLARQVRELFLPLLPGQLAAAMLATILAVAYRGVGLPMLLAATAVLLILQHLTVALLRSEDRAQQLEARSVQLVGLQVGVLRTLVRALAMRDQTTGRHAAAVARYGERLAAEIGCSRDEQEMVHTAGLLHEIGKFTWPDRVLHAEVVDPKDQVIIERHPLDGADLVGALDGYGTAAEAILYHHERVDGGGYPAGLIGSEIPLGSRILAICSAYDTMTSPEGYRASMSPEEAITELRNAATNGQFDKELVESFIALLERDGHALVDGADFDTELAFEQRVRKMAEPPSATPTSRSAGQARSPSRARTWRSGVRGLRARAANKG